MALTTPTVHLNGSGRSALQRGYADAYSAVCEAIRVLSEASPNGRDYYPQGPDAFRAAVAEHDARLDRLTSVRDELLALFESLDEPMEVR